jgi:hypothetical protein
MTIPDFNPTTTINRPIYPKLFTSPYSPSWWTTTTATGITETSVGYLLAQGWTITRTYVTDDVTYYDLTRQSMMNWKILQTMLDSYTYAYNEGRDFNATRYNDLITSWGNLIVNTREQLDTQGDLSDAHMTIYATQVTNLLTDLEADILLPEAEIEACKTDVDAQLDLYLTRLNELVANYDTHAALTRGLLTTFGTTETARINEQFDNLISTAKQGLVNRGLYSSILFASIQTRIERERSEALTKWNDQLAREKIDHEHKLFAELMDAKRAEIAGRTTFTAASLQKSGFYIESRTKLIGILLQGRLEKANAVLAVRDREDKTMTFQLDSYNNVVMALHAFQERREDSYPPLESVTQLVAGIGDSGGGWVTP